MKITLGVENLKQNFDNLDLAVGNVALLAHAASVDQNYIHTVDTIKSLYGNRFKALFGPQHGFVCDVQDNMVETKDFIHPHYKVPVYSLYGNTRIPTDDMLEDIDTIFVDLADVGTRVYTYISTLYLLMEKCQEKNIKIIILDRPNPVGGEIIEGNILELEYQSFVGLAETPMRHGMTMGEVAKFYQKKYFNKCSLEIIPMLNWKREYHFNDCNLDWINPSPNLSTPISSLTFCGSVLFEGTNISEGRGTTRALEQLGFPGVDPYKFTEFFYGQWKDVLDNSFILRPVNFLPTFQKHSGKNCGGVFIHPLNKNFRSWQTSQLLLKTWIKYLGESFEWNEKPYEYKFKGLAIDYINGSKSLRDWYYKDDNNKSSFQELFALENNDLLNNFKNLRKENLIY